VRAMRCQNVRELLSPYIDLVLSDEEKTRIEEHLAACESCRKELAELQHAVNRIRGMEKREAPSDFMNRLHERLQQEKVAPFSTKSRQNRLVSYTSGWLVASVASIALIIGIYASSLVPYPMVASFFEKIPQVFTPQDSELRSNIEKFLAEKKLQMHTALNLQQPGQEGEKKPPKQVNNRQPQQVAVVPENNEPANANRTEEVVKPMLIKTVNLQLSAVETDEIADSLMDLAEANGVQVETSGTQLMAGVSKVMTLRVTPEKVGSIVTGVDSLGCLTQPMHGTQDVTEEYKNLKKRLGEVEAEISRLQGLEELDADESNKLQAMLFEKSYLEDKIAELEAQTKLVAVNVMITEEPNH
ncbi:MAG: zf-HC2 domain-containing protein, partial [Bacillota bacterium]